jgi:1,4-dihydroxy-2-naphthoate octaprenyltransferase
MVGAACAAAAGGLRWDVVAAALGCALWVQIGANFANDVFDFEKGADTEERLGPVRAVQAGLLTPAQARRGMVLTLALSGACAAYLVWVAGWPLAVVGVLAVLSAIAYTGGPYPLGYHGLGDLFVLLFFGFVAVGGTVYSCLGRIPELAWWSALPVGCLATAILVVNNLRDRVTDEASGKRTLAVRLGRRGAVAELALLLAASYGTTVVLHLRGLAGPAIHLPWLTAPWAAMLIYQAVHRSGRPLNATLVSTARLLLVFGLLLTAGILI